MIALLSAVAAGLMAMALRPHRVQAGQYLSDATLPSGPKHRPSTIPAGVIWGTGVGWLVGNATGRTISLTILGAAAGEKGRAGK